MRAAVLALTNDHRQAIVLFEFERLSHEEIANLAAMESPNIHRTILSLGFIAAL